MADPRNGESDLGDRAGRGLSGVVRRLRQRAGTHEEIAALHVILIWFIFNGFFDLSGFFKEFVNPRAAAREKQSG